MHHTAKMSAARTLMHTAASISGSHTFPAWIDSAESGAGHRTVMPRVRDGLVLRLVAGRRQERDASPIHATGAH
jgi:hypothetical protein